MAKFLILTVLVCAVLASAYGGRGGFGRQGNDRGPGGGGGHGGGHGGGGHGDWSTQLCANSSLAQSFLNQTLQLIANLNSNGSYGQVLANRAQSVAYIQSATNAALLSSNCTAYFSGLKTAQQADQAVLNQQRQLEQNAGQLLAQIVRSLVGGGGGYPDDD